MKLTTKKIVIAGALLALMIISQLFKNLSVFITGPIVNAILIIATLTCGPVIGVILSIISPITAFFIAASPIMQGIPLIIPVIGIANSILCLCTYFISKAVKNKAGLPISLIAGSVLKAAFMGVVIVLILLPAFSGNIKVPAEKLPKVLETAKNTFTVVQLITALIGSALAYIIWIIAGKHLKNLAE